MLGQTKRGMTLVEVLIAIAISGFVSAGLYGSAIYTMRQTARNVEHIYALQIINSAAARVRAASFAKLSMDPSALTASDYEKQFSQTHTIQGDPLDPRSTSYTLTYKLKGFGSGMEMNGNPNVRLFLPNHSPDWQKDEYNDHLLVVTAGRGANQVMRIKKNLGTVEHQGQRKVLVQLTRKFKDSDPGPDDWDINPDESSVFAVDYGLYCDITCAWGDGAGHKTISEVVYVPGS